MSDATHVTHCCIRHGCKYGDGDKCPVESGRLKQEHDYEFCDEDRVVVVYRDRTHRRTFERSFSIEKIYQGPGAEAAANKRVKECPRFVSDEYEDTFHTQGGIYVEEVS